MGGLHTRVKPQSRETPARARCGIRTWEVAGNSAVSIDHEPPAACSSGSQYGCGCMFADACEYWVGYEGYVS